MGMMIAVTGGFCAGKSAIVALWKRHQAVDSIDMDAIVADLYVHDEAIKKLALQLYGEQCLHEYGVDRDFLRSRFFLDVVKKKQFEQLVHARVWDLLLAHRRQGQEKVLLVETPLLAESGRQPYYHRVIVVDAPLSLQLQRSRQRGFTQADAQTIIQAQSSRWQRLRLADEVLYNYRDYDFVLEQLLRLAVRYR